MAQCENCARPLQTYLVTCRVCKKDKWPYLAEPPGVYTCTLCRLTPATVYQARRKGGLARAAQRRSQASS